MAKSAKREAGHGKRTSATPKRQNGKTAKRQNGKRKTAETEGATILINEAQKCPKRGALSICPCGDPWGTPLQLEISYSWSPIKPPRGQTLRSPRPKVHFCAYPTPAGVSAPFSTKFWLSWCIHSVLLVCLCVVHVICVCVAIIYVCLTIDVSISTKLLNCGPSGGKPET